MAEAPATFKQKTIQSMLESHFKDEKTKINAEALTLVTEVIRAFVAEAACRASLQAQKDVQETVAMEQFEKILPQLGFVPRSIEQEEKLEKV